MGWAVNSSAQGLWELAHPALSPALLDVPQNPAGGSIPPALRLRPLTVLLVLEAACSRTFSARGGFWAPSRLHLPRSQWAGPQTWCRVVRPRWLLTSSTYELKKKKGFRIIRSPSARRCTDPGQNTTYGRGSQSIWSTVARILTAFGFMFCIPSPSVSPRLPQVPLGGPDHRPTDRVLGVMEELFPSSPSPARKHTDFPVGARSAGKRRRHSRRSTGVQ